MKLLSAYIAKIIIAAILLVLLVALGLDTIFRLIDEMNFIKNDYGVREVFIYVALTLPGRVVDYLPFSALIGSMAGLGMLANNSELVVMRSAGVSIARLIWSVMKPAMFIVVLGAIVGEYVAPVTEKIAISRQAILLDGKNQKKSTNRGQWHREGSEFMHFNAVQAGGILYGVTVYRLAQSKRLKSALFAERALFDVDSKQWYLENINETVFNEATSEGLNTSLRTADRELWPTEFSPELLEFVVLKADELSMRGLWKYGNYLDSQGLSSSEYWLAFWEKCFQPLATASLILLAISFIFGPMRDETMGYRLFIGVLVGVIFRTLQDLLAPASLVFNFAPVYAVVVPILLCGLIGVYLLSRVR